MGGQLGLTPQMALGMGPQPGAAQGLAGAGGVQGLRGAAGLQGVPAGQVDPQLYMRMYQGAGNPLYYGQQ